MTHVGYRDEFEGDRPDVPAAQPAETRVFVDEPASPALVAQREHDRAMRTVNTGNEVHALTPTEINGDPALTGVQHRGPFEITAGHELFDPEDLT